MKYLCVITLVLLFASCNTKNEIKNTADVSMNYSIDQNLYTIRENIIDDLIANKFINDFNKNDFIENTFFSLDTLDIIRLDNHYHVVKKVFSDNFLILIFGYYETELTNGQKISPYKTIYLYNLKTLMALEVSNKWIEGATSNFYIQDDNVIVKQINDSSYDLINSHIPNEGMDDSKKKSYLVVKLNDFFIVDESSSQTILKKNPNQ